MLLTAGAILVGLAILVWSSDVFVAGAASIAENFGLSPVIIGLTIVSMGTSAPEVLVSINAALAGAPELAVGNALGSNIANIGLVLGVTVLIAPMMVNTASIRIELPMLLVVTIGTGLLLLDNYIGRLDSILMLAALFVLLAQMLRVNTGDKVLLKEAEAGDLPHLPPGRAWLSFFIGLLLLIGSSRLLVWGATGVAEALGVSTLIIGLTVVAVGTSLPEMAATIACALKGHSDMAIGNVIGSNLFNLLGVMSIAGIIEPIDVAPEVLTRDYPAMILATCMLAVAVYSGSRRKRASAGHAYIGRWVGGLLTVFYGLYYYWLSLTL